MPKSRQVATKSCTKGARGRHVPPGSVPPSPSPSTSTNRTVTNGIPTSEDEDGNISITQSDVLGPRQDPRIRRELRQKYLSLREQTQANRHELIKPGSDELQKTLEKADGLFSQVKETREAAMDSQVVAYISQLAKQQAQALHTDFHVFEPVEFAEKLITLVSGNRLRESERDRARISREGWVKLGEAAQPFFKRSPPLRVMYGSFEKGPRIEKKPVRQPKPQEVRDNEKGPRGPTLLNNFRDQEQQEVTTVEVEKMLSTLQKYYQKWGNRPLCFFEFIVNPDSFGQTIENLFYASFLVRDGVARVFLDPDKLPVIEPIHNAEGEEAIARLPRHQVVMTMTQQEWREIINTYQIEKPLIEPRASTLGVTNGTRSPDGSGPSGSRPSSRASSGGASRPNTPALQPRMPANKRVKEEQTDDGASKSSKSSTNNPSRGSKRR